MSDPRFANPKDFFKLMELADSGSCPKEIVDLKAKIEAETRGLQFQLGNGLPIEEGVKKVVEMKRELDRLYILWSRDAL